MAAKAADYDVAIVGASLAGCTAAILLSRAGARVALIEKSPDPSAFKRVCSHFIQASAVPTIERLGLYEPILDAGGLRTRFHSGRAGGGSNRPRSGSAYCLNLRRELLDPMLRETAAAEPGVELMLGQTAVRLLRDGGGFGGVVVRDREGNEREIGAKLTVGADGRDSQVAEMAEVEEQDPPPQSPRLRRLLRGAEDAILARRRGLVPRSRHRRRLPHRRRPDLLHRDGEQGPGAGIQGGPRAGAGRPRRRHPGPAADPREPLGRPGDRQGRDAEPDPRAGRARPGPGRRRRPRQRPALRGRLRVRLPVRRMAGRQRLPGAARDRVPGERSAPLPQAPPPRARQARAT